MYQSKWILVSTIVVLLITEKRSEEQPKYQESILLPYQMLNTPPYWEHVLRESIYRTISPPPPGNIVLYKRLLDAPFFGGPFPIITKDETSVILSRGDVYYQPKGHWMLCQEGCIACEVCIEQKNPTVKWVLRRIKRVSPHNSPRYDLQLTIIPQIDGSYHMKNLWPRSYIYVTSQGEQTAYWNDKSGYASGKAFKNTEDVFPGQQERPNNFWKLVEKDSMPDRHANEEVFLEPKMEDTPEHKPRQKILRKQRPRVDPPKDSLPGNSSERKKSETNPFMLPKLILGTDQQGQKHLVHLVPADHPPGVATLVNPTVLESPAGSKNDHATRSNKTLQDRKGSSSYKRILRKIFDSLSNNKHSIENFLLDKSPTGYINPQSEEHEQQETRNSATGLKQVGPLPNGSVLSRPKLPFNWYRLRRKSLEGAGKGNFGNATMSFNKEAFVKAKKIQNITKRDPTS